MNQLRIYATVSKKHAAEYDCQDNNFFVNSFFS